MLVAVTGGTGFVGAYTTAALIEAGHTPRLLVRSKDRLIKNVAPLGIDVDAIDIVIGDMTDVESVRRAVSGADAVIHSAAVVAALDRSEGERVIDMNVNGTKVVVGEALAAGAERVVHVSSVAAVFNKQAPVLTTDLPTASDADSPYTRSKALSEDYVRGLQEQGKNVTIVYPGGVTGPSTGDAEGEVAEGFVSMLKAGVVVLSEGKVLIIDVRDLALVMVAALSTEPGPHRFMVGGQLTSMAEIATMLRDLTGRRMPLIPTPGIVFRTLGKVIDQVRRVVPFQTVFTAEAMELLTLAQPTDDRLVHDQLGITYRDRVESVEAMLRSLHSSGRLSDRQVGSLPR